MSGKRVFASCSRWRTKDLRCRKALVIEQAFVPGGRQGQHVSISLNSQYFGEELVAETCTESFCHECCL